MRLGWDLGKLAATWGSLPLLGAAGSIVLGIAVPDDVAGAVGVGCEEVYAVVFDGADSARLIVRHRIQLGAAVATSSSRANLVVAARSASCASALRFFAAASAMSSMLPERTAAACILMMSVEASEALSRHVESVLRHVETRYDQRHHLVFSHGAKRACSINFVVVVGALLKLFASCCVKLRQEESSP